MHSMAEQRAQRCREARPFVIFLAFMFWVVVGGFGRVITGGLAPAQWAFVAAVVGIAVTEATLRWVIK